jgi:hypothetical protein
MEDGRMLVAELRQELAVDVTVPQGLGDEAHAPRDAAQAVDRVVVDGEAQDLVPVRLQQARFVLERLVFPAALLVVVVTEQDSQRPNPPWRSRVIGRLALAKKSPGYRACVEINTDGA